MKRSVRLLADVLDRASNTPRQHLGADAGCAACLGCRQLTRQVDAAPQHLSVG